MPRGQPDYNVPDFTFFTIEASNNDILAEQSGFSRLDNRGRIMWVDDFRSGLSRWSIDSDLGGSLPIQIYQSPFRLGYNGSILIDPNVNDGESLMLTDLILPVSVKLGVELGIWLPVSFSRVDIFLYHAYTDGTTLSASIRLEEGTGKLLLFSDTSTITVVTPSTLTLMTSRWIVIKLVANYSTGYYDRLMFGNTQFDLSAHKMGAGITGLKGATRVEIFVHGKTGANVEPVYIGYVIISGDEP